MTIVSATSRAQFHTLKIQMSEMLTEIALRRAEARANGDQALADALFAVRAKIVERSINIRLAEIAFLNSAMAHDDAVAKLLGAVKSANAGLTKMQQLADALAGAAKFLSVLTRLVPLFP